LNSNFKIEVRKFKLRFTSLDGWICVQVPVSNQPTRSTQSGPNLVGRCNEYHPKGDDALWLWSRSRCGSRVGGR